MSKMARLIIPEQSEPLLKEQDLDLSWTDKPGIKSVFIITESQS
jgi:hypothetical protein